MARNLTSNFVTAATSASCRPAVLFEGVFATSTLRLWNGLGDLTWNSNTWFGNGWFQGIEGGDETGEVEAVDMMVLLSGVPSSVISLAIGDQKQGAIGNLYLAMLDSNGAIIANPYLWWKGFYSHADIEHDPGESTVKLYYDSPIVFMDRPKEGRWTNDQQVKAFAGDKGFEFVVAAADFDNNWGDGKKDKNDKKQKRPRAPKGGSGGKKRT